MGSVRRSNKRETNVKKGKWFILLTFVLPSRYPQVTHVPISPKSQKGNIAHIPQYILRLVHHVAIKPKANRIYMQCKLFYLNSIWIFIQAIRLILGPA